MTHFADCWPFHTCCDLMELRAIGGPDEQGGNNILLHVHLEGKPRLHSRSLAQLPLPLLKLKLLAVWCGAYCPAAQLNHPHDLSAPPLNEIPKPLNRVDQLLTIYSPRGSAAVLRGVPAHPSGAVRRRGDGSAGAGQQLHGRT